VKDPELESGFDPVLHRIQYLAENDLTSLMMPHDFLSRRLMPLQDWPAYPAWLYTKALTTDKFLIDLVVPVAVCEPICANQAARTTLLATIPTLDDVDIAPVQRGDQSRGVVIPGADGSVGAAGGHGQGPAGGRGGVSASDGPAGGRGGVSAGGRGGGPTGSSGLASTPGKGKQARAILNDDVVWSDEDAPLQKRLWRLSGAAGPSGSGPAPIASDAAVAAAAAVDKEVADKRAAEEAVVTRAAEEVAEKAAADKKVADKRAMEEAVERAVANKEAVDKSTADEVAVTAATVGAVGDSSAPARCPP
jgi:hypothetical protein